MQCIQVCVCECGRNSEGERKGEERKRKGEERKREGDRKRERKSRYTKDLTMVTSEKWDWDNDMHYLNTF